MPHFIWMGNLNTEVKIKACSSGPMSLAEHAPDLEINMWVPESLLNQTTEIFHDIPNVQVKSVEGFFDGEYGELEHISDEDSIQIKELLEAMEQEKSYTAQKDLFSYIVIHELGGSFFDCTVKFYDRPDFSNLTDIKILMPMIAKLLEEDQLGKSFLPLYASDVWSFATKERGHDLFKFAYQEALSNFKNYGWSNTMTGGSIAYALQQCYGEEIINTKDWIEQNTVYYADNSDPGFEELAAGEHAVPEFSMIKYHTGMWRREENVHPSATSKMEEVNYKAFLKLGLFDVAQSPNEDSQSNSEMDNDTSSIKHK